jgi:hypothetical protein
VQTNRTIPNNISDIIVHDNEKLAYMLTYAAISGGRNVIKKEAKKILKYLTIGMQFTWNAKTEVIPLIIGATATV